MRPQWNKKIWVARQIPNEEDDYGRPKYEKPEVYYWNVQPVSADDDMQEFGQNVSLMQKALIENTPKNFGKFHAYDVAYLDGVTPEGETVYGSKANYRLLPPRNQNKCIRIYLEKIIPKNIENAKSV